jgi:hypothetical protein
MKLEGALELRSIWGAPINKHDVNQNLSEKVEEIDDLIQELQQTVQDAHKQAEKQGMDLLGGGGSAQQQRAKNNSSRKFNAHPPASTVSASLAPMSSRVESNLPTPSPRRPVLSAEERAAAFASMSSLHIVSALAAPVQFSDQVSNAPTSSPRRLALNAQERAAAFAALASHRSAAPAAQYSDQEVPAMLSHRSASPAAEHSEQVFDAPTSSPRRLALNAQERAAAFAALSSQRLAGAISAVEPATDRSAPSARPDSFY